MPIKGIIWGSLSGISFGIAAYFLILLGFISYIGVDKVTGELVGNFFRSSLVYILSFPVTAVLMTAAGYLAAVKSKSSHYVAAIFISTLVCLSIKFAPFKLWSIYMNYIPVVAGTFLGVYLQRKK